MRSSYSNSSLPCCVTDNRAWDGHFLLCGYNPKREKVREEWLGITLMCCHVVPPRSSLYKLPQREFICVSESSSFLLNGQASRKSHMYLCCCYIVFFFLFCCDQNVKKKQKTDKTTKELFFIWLKLTWYNLFVRSAGRQILLPFDTAGLIKTNWLLA